MPRFPDSPEGVALALALALAYLVAQSKGEPRERVAAGYDFALYRKCLEVVVGGEIVGTRH